MIIKIEDAPKIKNIKIDISFDEDGNSFETKSNIDADFSSIHKEQEVALDLDETFDISKEVVEKPDIPDIDRDVKVSDDMVNAEF